MSPWLIVLIVVAVCVAATGLLWRGRKAPSSVLREQVRKADPKTVEAIDQVPVALRNPVALPMHDRSFDRPR
jgi:hypothetical protein